jgi:uncharacterized integral membrane protein (TIGR00697 family)
MTQQIYRQELALLEHIPITRANYLYMILGVFFCTILVVCNTLGTKLIAAPYPQGLSLPVGMILYPVTFLISDLLAEVWGRKRAQLVIGLGFIMTLFLLAMIRLAIALPPGEEWFVPNNPYGFISFADYQRALEATFSTTSFAIWGSLTAYTVAQLVDVFLFSRIKEATGGKYLWLRTNISTWLSQIIDSIIIGLVVYRYGFKMEIGQCFHIIAWTYGYKVIVAFLLTPMLYMMIAAVKEYCTGCETVAFVPKT